MNREQAINYLISSGFTHEQVGEVVRALTYEPTTKNDLGVDCISREQALDLLCKKCPVYNCIQKCVSYKAIEKMPSVTPQEPIIKALGEELRKARKGITDEKVLIGYNMAIAICNKHLGESEVEDGNDD